MPAVIPAEFVYLYDIAPAIHQDVRYATNNNFIGRPIKGYNANVCILTKRAAQALANVQKELSTQYNYSLLVYDCYRPQQASDDMKEWSLDIADQKNKQSYYPNVDKKDFYELGYVAEKSGHSRGSTVDLTIIDNKTGKPLDMGTIHDFMDPLSHPDNHNVTTQQYENRQFLKKIMEEHGFVGIETEWWHFSLKQEPFFDQYFNFVVERGLSEKQKEVALNE